MDAYFNGNRYDPSAAYAAQQGSMQNAQNAYDANQQRLAAQAAYEAQQQAAAPNTYANRIELEKELAYNENEIRYLQNQLENMRTEWMDQDSFDRKLAANRAAIGDFANARAHQNDIIARQNDRNRVADTAMQWRWQAKQNEIARQADKEKQAKADIKRLIGEIEDIDAQKPYHTEVGAKNALEAKRARLVRELGSYGVSIEGQQPKDNNNVSLDNVASIVQNENSSDYKDKNGWFLDADKREEIAAAYEKLGLKAEAKRVRETPTVQEKQNKKADWEKGRKEAASLIEKYRAKTQAEIATLTNKVNAKTDPDIKKILKYATYDQKTGQFKMKE